MLIRLIILIIIYLYRRSIYDFFIYKKLPDFSLSNINKSISNTLNNIVKDKTLKPNLKMIKKMNREFYKEIKYRLKNIDYYYNNLDRFKIKNIYDNIKEERKDILNIISSLEIKKDIHNIEEIKKNIDSYITNIINNIRETNNKNKINVDWFEDDTLEVEHFDPKINYNYSIY
jgi:tRNA nucleotidyltransferase/poly(A) polymerase